MKHHLKRLAAPKTWFVKRKEHTFITKPKPGKHSLKMCLPFSMILKDFIRVANTSREVKKLLNLHEFLVDGKRERDIKAGIGFMDTISIPSLNKFFRVVINEKGRLALADIDKEKSAVKTCKIIGKRKIKGGKVQLNLFDSRNILVDKDSYKVGDSLVIEVPSQKIIKHLKLDRGALIVIIDGKSIGQYGTVNTIKEEHIAYSTKNGNGETLKDYSFVLENEQ